MTIEASRKKVQDPADEEWRPKRKIKRRLDARHIEKALSNVTIVSKIFDFMVGDGLVMQNLDLRRVSRTFDNACIHSISKQFRHLQIVDLKSDKMAEINEMPMTLTTISKFFEFLRQTVKVRVETIEFVEFEQENRLIHDCVLQELFKFSAVHVRTFRGADEICQFGCVMCHVLASRSDSYGPMQWGTLSQGFLQPRHFKHLLITEILLYQIALHCLESVVSSEAALQKLHKIIGNTITCDVLEVVLSDYSRSNEFTWKSLTHPRNVIDCIVKSWKPTSVKIKFLTGYSSLDSTVWQSKDVFDEIRFDAQYIRQTVVTHTERLSHLEIDMMQGDAIAEFLLGQTLITNSSMMKLCTNARKVFPADHVYVTLPLSLHNFARDRFDEFCKVLMAFVWSEERSARHLTFYVRLYCYGLTEETIKKQIQPEYSFRGRPIIPSIIVAPNMILESFSKWHPEYCMSNFTPVSYVSFRDHSNQCALHLEVCVENEE